MKTNYSDLKFLLHVADDHASRSPFSLSSRGTRPLSALISRGQRGCFEKMTRGKERASRRETNSRARGWKVSFDPRGAHPRARLSRTSERAIQGAPFLLTDEFVREHVVDSRPAASPNVIRGIRPRNRAWVTLGEYRCPIEPRQVTRRRSN